MAVEESRSSAVCESKHNPVQSPGDMPDEDSRSPEDTEPKLQTSGGAVDSSNGGSPQSGEDVPPLPNEAPPSNAEEDDGWQALWDQNVQAYYFYNSHTGITTWTNPRVPEASSTVDTPGVGNYDRISHSGDNENGNREPQKPRPHGGLFMAIMILPPLTRISTKEPPRMVVTQTAGAFNRFTGKWQPLDVTPELHNDENKSRRQMSAFFDVDAAANSHDGRSLKAERSGKKLTKKELKAFKEKRREKKEEKRRAWLRD
ncbi:MAG: hypothetical protein M1840_008507 [Geoglossum simile]|nr:MAG: hypothetical protein M1840_008507 [Geoglossum simile]